MSQFQKAFQHRPAQLHAIVALFLFLLLSPALHAQTLRVAVIADGERHWSVINQQGDVILESKYRFIDAYTEEGVVLACEGSDYAYCRLLDTLGNRIATDVELKVHASTYTGPPVGINCGMLIVKQTVELGAVNIHGKLIVDRNYKSLTDFYEGYALGQKRGDFYLIDTSGHERLLDKLGKIDVVRHFSEGLAPVEVKDGGFGFIDTTGAWVIEPRFLTVGYFSGGIAWARDRNNKIGFIDTSGEWLISPKFEAAFDFDTVSGLAMVKYNYAWQYVRTDGELLSFGITDKPYRFFEGLAIGRKGTKLGYINNRGEWVIEPQFDVARKFENGYARVELNKRWGLIDTEGNWVLQPVYKAVGRYSEF